MNDGASDILAIIALTARLAQAADDRDVDGYAACLATVVDGVARSSYAAASIERVSGMSWTHHQLTNHVVTVSDGRAVAAVDVVVDMALARPGGSRAARIGGRYDLSLVKTDGSWFVEHRIMHRRYVHGDLDLAGG